MRFFNISFAVIDLNCRGATDSRGIKDIRVFGWIDFWPWVFFCLLGLFIKHK
jgi:hypothetical protein